MIVNLEPKYRDYSDRIRVLERQFFNGSNQILLYAEAYICFQERVLLLRKLESFEIQILNFATKYKIITKELALYAAELISQQKKYNPKLVRILERAYEMYGDTRILNALCMQLIKGNKSGTAYFKWYEKAVQQAFRDIRDALASQRGMAESAKNLAQAAERMAKAADLARKRYAEGYSPYLDVLEAERTQYGAQMQFLERQSSLLAAIAQVCVALGGGW
jgi:hypothetical protein